MKRLASALSIVVIAAFAAAAVEQLGDLRRPPSVIPADAPKLSPLLVDAAGNPITAADSWQKRRAAIRRQWLGFMGEFPSEKCKLEPEVRGTEQLDGFVRQLVRYQVEPDVWVEAYLLRPTPGLDGEKGVGSLLPERPEGCFAQKTPDPFFGAKRPAMVAFHQTTNETIRSPAGLDDKPELHMGVQLARRGYVVICPECFIFPKSAGYVEHVEAMQRRHPTWKGMTRMTWDAIRAVDYLESLPYVDRDRIGGIGHSLGAKEALYAAAFDERYKVAVASEGGIGLAFSNWHDVCYLGPDIKRPDFPLEHHQLIGLIAPRTFLLLAGESADNDRSWSFIDAALPVYRLLGAERSIGWLNHRDGHRFSPRAQQVGYEFVDEVIGRK